MIRQAAIATTAATRKLITLALRIILILIRGWIQKQKNEPKKVTPPPSKTSRQSRTPPSAIADTHIL